MTSLRLPYSHQPMLHALGVISSLKSLAFVIDGILEASFKCHQCGFLSVNLLGNLTIFSFSEISKPTFAVPLLPRPVVFINLLESFGLQPSVIGKRNAPSNVSAKHLSLSYP